MSTLKLCYNSSMDKKEYHHGNLKQELLDIAFDFIAKEGVEKLTLKVLADKTNTSRSAIYRHFNSKDALIENIIKLGFKEFDSATVDILNNKNIPLIDRFYMATKAYIMWAKENQNLYRLLFGKKYAHIREAIIDIKSEDCCAFAYLIEAIEEGQKQGIIKKESSYKQAITIWSSLHGLSSLIIDGFMNVEEIYEELIDNLFETLLSGVVSNKVKIISTIPFVNRALKYKN